MEIDSTPTEPTASTSTDSASTTTTSTTTAAEDKEKAEKKERDAKRELAKKKKLQQELNQIGEKLPEADCFLSLLVVISLLDRGEYENVSSSYFSFSRRFSKQTSWLSLSAPHFTTGQAIRHSTDWEVLCIEPKNFGSTHE